MTANNGGWRPNRKARLRQKPRRERLQPRVSVRKEFAMCARCIVLAAILGFVSSCSTTPHGPTIRPGEPEPKIEPGLSEDECRELAERIAKAVQGKDPAALAKVFDWDALIENASG